MSSACPHRRPSETVLTGFDTPTCGRDLLSGPVDGLETCPPSMGRIVLQRSTAESIGDDHD
jgi:hypothetical protein